MNSVKQPKARTGLERFNERYGPKEAKPKQPKIKVPAQAQPKIKPQQQPKPKSVPQPQEQVKARSGIRMYKGEPRYRCWYRCTNHGHKGNRYILPGTKFVCCHKCNQKLFVRPAKYMQDLSLLPEPDAAGNYYAATKGYMVPRQKKKAE